MKTKKQWDGSGQNLTVFLEIGDPVDEEMYFYFLEVLPPATYTSELLQIGEPYDHVNGRATFMTLHREGRQWIYRGCCHRGQHAEPIKQPRG